MLFTIDITPTITICVPITAKIKPIKRVTMLSPALPTNFRMLVLKIKQKNVIKHNNAKTEIVMTMPDIPPDEEKFIAVAMVPGPASKGTANGDTATSESSWLFAECNSEP